MSAKKDIDILIRKANIKRMCAMTEEDREKQDKRIEMLGKVRKMISSRSVIQKAVRNRSGETAAVLL